MNEKAPMLELEQRQAEFQARMEHERRVFDRQIEEERRRFDLDLDARRSAADARARRTERRFTLLALFLGVMQVLSAGDDAQFVKLASAVRDGVMQIVTAVFTSPQPQG